MNKDLLQIFGLKSSLANLYRRKHTAYELKSFERSIARWQSLYNSADENSVWFIQDRLKEDSEKLERYSKRLAYLQQEAKAIREEEKTGIPRKETYKEYDKEAINSIPIVRILADAGVQIIPVSSRQSKCLCVAHNERNASMMINTEKNYVHCFSCGFGADVIKLYQHIHNVDFINALKELDSIL